MINVYAIIFGIFILTLPAMAQIYDHHDRRITKPVDDMIEKINTLDGNTAKPGDSEATRSQEQRYKDMTQPVNEANERHFNTGLNEPK